VHISLNRHRHQYRDALLEKKFSEPRRYRYIKIQFVSRDVSVMVLTLFLDPSRNHATAPSISRDRATSSRKRPTCVRLFAVVVAFVLFGTLAMTLVVDSDVIFSARCQMKSLSLRLRAFKGEVREGRRGINHILAEADCLHAQVAVIARTNMRARAAATAAAGRPTASPAPLATDIKPEKGVITTAATGREMDRRHEELKAEAVLRIRYDAAKAAAHRQRKDEELAGSVARAYEEVTAIVGVLPDAVDSMYSVDELDAHYPPLPLGNGTRDWNECGWCNVCVVSESSPRGNVSISDGVNMRSRNDTGRTTVEDATFQSSISPKGRRRSRLRKLLDDDEHNITTYADEEVEDAPQDLSADTRKLLMTVSLDRDAVNFHADDGKPRCQICTGCTSVFQNQHLNVSFGPFRYTNEAGASSASVFRASSPRAADGWGVAKTFCFEKRHKNGEVYNMPPCDSNPGTKLKHLHTIGRMVAMQALADECGIADVAVRHWRERIQSSNPNTGDKIDSEVLFMDRAQGVSLEQLTRQRPDRIIVNGNLVSAPSTVKFVHDVVNAVDSAKIVRAALFDVLMGQCDRHGQNMFITIDGDITLIDSDQAFGRGWRRCVVDSVMIPGSEKYTIARYGNNHVFGNSPPTRDVNVQTLLDYRCHVPNGEIGGMYPFKFKTCIKWLSNATVPSIVERFGFTADDDAKFVRERAASLLNLGFEQTVLNAQRTLREDGTQTGKAKTFDWPEPCCSLDELHEGRLVGYTCKVRYDCDGGYEECTARRRKVETE
jgi:hypothetical protein